MLPITSGVTIPSTIRAIGTVRRKYPFNKLEVGDMFFVPERAKNNLSTGANLAGKQLGMKFLTRLLYMVLIDERWLSATAETEDAVLGIGVWRTE